EKTAEWQVWRVGKKEKKEKLKNAPMGRFCVLNSCLKTRVCAHFLINLIEWTSVMLDGVSGLYRIWLVINKFLNYRLIPFLGYFVIHIWVRHLKYDRLLAVLLPGNVLFQLASIATG
ncbi:MAG: hypothetical protein WAX41_06100, partial [Lactobacillus delbrueckii]